MARRVVVVGAGIAGLAVSFELMQRAGSLPFEFDLLCLESSSNPGGNIRTIAENGFICEWGPNGFLDNVPATLDLVHRLGLDDRLLPADEQAALRFIYRKGKLRRVPEGPLDFLTSDVLSLRGKLRLMCEPFAGKRPTGIEETVHQFAARRIGREAARVLVGAMVTGVYAGDAERLCLRSTFPKMYDMETEYGGLLRAMIAKARQARRDHVHEESGRGGGPSGPGGHLHSFKDGLQSLIDRLSERLGSRLALEHEVTSVGPGSGKRFVIRSPDRDPVDADAVVLACPAWKAADIVREIDPEMAGAMAGISSAPLAVVHLGFQPGRLSDRPEGFGFLVPRREGCRILGVLWASNIFPGRCPENGFLMTAMVGGSHDPKVLERDDDGLVETTLSDIRKITGLEDDPDMVKVFRHPRGIPQYNVGHRALLADIEKRLELHPGLLVHGNSYRGISVNLCVEGAPAVAEAVENHLRF